MDNDAAVAGLTRLQRSLGGLPRTLIVGGVIVSGLVVVAVAARLIVPWDPYEIDLAHPLESPGQGHVLGTDYLGRDSFSRIIFGTRVALYVSCVSVVIAMGLGCIVGLPSGYFAGKIDLILMRFNDAILAFPAVVLALVIVSGLGRGLLNTSIAIGVVFAPQFARLVRAEALRIREQEYIASAQIAGLSHSRIMFRHVLPNAAPPLIIQMVTFAGFAILVEASLSFIGLGAEPPTASWGSMLQYGYTYLEIKPWGVFGPSIAVLLTVTGFLLLGEGLRDRLDPRRRRTGN